MALLQRTLAAHHRITKISSSSSFLNLTMRHSPFSSPFLETLVPPDPAAPKTCTFSRDYLSSTSSDSSEKGYFRRFLQKRTLLMPPELRSLPIGEKLIEKLRGLNVNKDRLRLDGLTPPPPPSSSSQKKMEESAAPNPFFNRISVEDARKLLKLSQLEMLKSTLRRIPNNSISYTEFVQICVNCSSQVQGSEFAKTLDESGVVIVLGNVVFLRPEQVAKAIQSVIPLHRIHTEDDPMKMELEKMEKEKTEIDVKAGNLVKRELWGGLGLLILQTAGFMRLTFWELSWDVMEPICFYVTSVYFMAGYAFFLRTSKDPSFEGFFQSRFDSKQKKLMKKRKFDVQRFNELRRVYYPSLDLPAPPIDHHADPSLSYALNH